MARAAAGRGLEYIAITDHTKSVTIAQGLDANGVKKQWAEIDRVNKKLKGRITVLKGTWWVNTGANYDPDGMKPVPAGSYVVHYGGQIHYDGAKDEECILQIVGR